MRLDRARQRDAEAMAAVHAAAFDEPWDARAIRGVIQGPGAFGFVLRDEADIAAFILARAVADEAEILTLAVDPARRRRGAGAALVEAAARFAAAVDARRLFLEVAADNTAALALYRGAGFADAGLRKAYYPRAGGGPVDALVLRRDLNSRPA